MVVYLLPVANSNEFDKLTIRQEKHHGCGDEQAEGQAGAVDAATGACACLNGTVLFQAEAPKGAFFLWDVSSTGERVLTQCGGLEDADACWGEVV